MEKKRILIVDDDADLSMLIVDMLEDKGYSASMVGSLDEAYTILEKEQFHLILLDINLPDGTGFSFCEELRRVSTVPVIFASARTSEDDKIVGLDMGGDDYIPKPYSLKELMSRINSLLRRTYGFESEGTKYILKAGKDNIIEIDTATRTVKKQGTVVNLSLREYDLLSYMAEKKDQYIAAYIADYNYSEVVLSYALFMANMLRKGLILLRIVDPKYTSETTSEAEERLKELRTKIKNSPLTETNPISLTTRYILIYGVHITVNFRLRLLNSP